jgi:Protein of unknown function (DUF4235)
MARILFAPISIVGGLLAGFAASRLFEFIWARFDSEEAPDPEHREVSWPKLGASLLLQGAVFRLVRGLVDHGSRAMFYRGTRSWPGEKRPEAT